MENQKTEKELYKDKMNLFFSKTKGIAIKNDKLNSRGVAFKSYRKEDVKAFLENPAKFEKELREISRYCYNTFGKYRRLINYMAQMPLYNYFIEPLDLKRDKLNIKSFEKAYSEVTKILANMNIAHEFSKVAITAFKEDVYYGYIHETEDTFCIQPLNPDYCKISSIEDGVFNFEFNFAFFDKDKDSVKTFPKEFQSKYNKYKNDKNLQWQELDPNYSICLKINEETAEYCIPPFASLFESLYDFNDYKALKKTKEEIGNYQLVSMKIPMSKDKADEYLLDPDEAMEYYSMASQYLPPYVGLILSPMDLDSVKFERDSINVDRVDEAEKLFWNEAGVNANLFNSTGSSGAVVDLSIKTDEAMVQRFLRQINRWINRKLKNLGGKIKFKINIMPVTVNNQSAMVEQYLKLAQFGVPVKMQLCSIIGLSNDEMLNSMYLENEVFKLHENMIPLVSSHTATATNSEGGRPAKKNTEVTESTERGQNAGSNDNKAVVG